MPSDRPYVAVVLTGVFRAGLLGQDFHVVQRGSNGLFRVSSVTYAKTSARGLICERVGVCRYRGSSSSSWWLYLWLYLWFWLSS